jgi:Chalcone isomerase-like
VIGISRRALLAHLAWGGACMPAWANGVRSAPGAEVTASLPGARLQGQGRMEFIGLHVYDIRLWVGEGFDAATFERHPLAIEIEYARAIAGHRLAERSLAEMQRVASVTPAQREAWLVAMKQAFPDVAAGDRLAGVHRPGGGARFIHNDNRAAEVADPAFARAFFGIWLSPRTSEPRLRAALLGSAA